ncbi:MAG: tyrosine-type recombinase/integrase [Bdellovibrionaceae bacterium]|jgi:integrase|nr:tyrosine-type recombinase/integrase [Pseudobdellovibrionaceae bacterium]
MKKADSSVVNMGNFGVNKDQRNSPLQSLIKYIVRETNRNKFSYSQLRYAFRCARQNCGVETPGQKTKKLYQLPSTDEIKQFFDVIENPVHRLIFSVLADSGLRIEELCSLEVRRIDFKTNIIFVNDGKGGKDRCTVIGNKTLEKIKLYLQGKNNRYLFESRYNSRYSTRRLQQMCKVYKEKAGIEASLTPHTFRHLLMTKLAHAGISKEKRMIIAGHSSEKTQDIYTHLGMGGIKDEVIAILDGGV